MFPYKIDNEISLILPNPEKHGPTMFNLIKVNRSYLAKWLPWANALKLVNDEVSFLNDNLKQYFAQNSLNLLIQYRNQLVGTISFNNINHNRKLADIGYWMGKEYSGHNIMHRCVLGMLSIGFEQYGLNKIMINAAVDNIASNHVAKNCDFHLDGVLREHELLLDGFHDENTWSMLKKEY
ncbi:N-acetyltransferase [Apilactobacillus micheneri]|uniref:N-acetyltransferase n=1 Tax=Apilactobacillus micheneri TaxID=1899430 RepID=A0A9Q8ILW3_9LACO|nr:GNAT family protein [Apilactobacillus micheneri]TPR39828.1 N-acetyltransferase [Apilactobacillus micheneri]TPR43749.1 N-acetyltransferase [Apilactobacillus micheneri]TPR45302.1 N-acetyltransferase [Apilactobacillus micheneri]TPR50388.1 N-acetyltransferase [Apilactobacillus micheneri]